MGTRQGRQGALERELCRAVRGTVRFDRKSRVLYASDASIHRLMPLGVVCPLDVADARATVEIAAARGVPILPRGGGTSLAGQTVGEALVLDFSRFMHRVLDIDPERREARVEPGVVLGQLNHAVSPHGLQFGPDVATADRACLGGMIGNNSSGAHSIIHGKTIDHVRALDVLLADGQAVTLTAPGDGDRQVAARLEQLRDGVRAIVERHAEAIGRDYPHVLRRVMGYNLDAVLAAPDHLAPLVVGSEGTLATIVGARVGLVPLPAYTGLAVIASDSVFDAADRVPALAACEPAAIELIDRTVLRLAREADDYVARTRWIAGEPGAMLLVEMQGETREAVRDGLERLRAATGSGATVTLLEGAAEQADVWAVRRAGLGILLRMRGARKPIGFVEDTAVDPARLGEYLRRFQAILEHHDAEAVFYGHASVGCLHIRPVLDLRAPADVARMRAIGDEVAALVRAMGGSLSGEHGDGLLRSPYIESMLGPELARAFGEVKALFDPQRIMNPGKIVDPPPFGSHLRFAPGDQVPEPLTELDFRSDGGYAAAVELCNGNGLCRKLDHGTMCPSYMITREEEHSTRGRAHLLDALLRGELDAGDGGDEAVREALDLCLQCKACRRECPTGVDMARLKVEFLAGLHERHGASLADRLYGRFRQGIALAARMPALANRLGRSATVRAVLERVAGVDRRRSLPELPAAAFRAMAPESTLAAEAAPPATVVLFDDEFVGPLEPAIPLAALAVLDAAGERVALPPRPVSSARSLISRGMLAAAREELLELLEALEAPLAAGLPVVGLEPSALLTFRDELLALLPDDARAARLASACQLFDEFMLDRMHRIAWRQEPVRILVHAHCHRQAIAGTDALGRLLEALPGVEATILDAGCCGMAGSFGYDRRHYDLSMAVGERVLFPAVRGAGPETLLLIEGMSCRHQVLDGTGRRGLHTAEVLARRLPVAPGSE